MSRASLLLAAVLFATGPGGSPIVAGQAAIFKCVSREGRAAYQSTPCRVGTTQAWVREVVTLPSPPAPVVPGTRQTSRTRAQVEAGTPARTRYRAADRPHGDPRAEACANAKARRADQRDRQWRTIRFDQLRALDDEVSRACRGAGPS